MKRITAIIFIIVLNMSTLCQCGESNGMSDKAASVAIKCKLSGKRIRDLVLNMKISGVLTIPEQKLVDRISYLNSLLVKNGISHDQVVFTVDPMLTDILCPTLVLENKKMLRVLVYTMDSFKIMYRIFDGEIRFMPQTLENIEKYPNMIVPMERPPQKLDR